MSVLVTSASRKLPLLRSIEADLRGLDPDVRVQAADADPHCLASYAWPHFTAMPRLDHAPADEVCAWIVEQGAAVVMPTRDDDVLFLARHRSVLAAAGVESMTGDEAAVHACLDKLEFARILMAAGVAAIPTFVDLDSLEGHEAVVVKERHGAGSRGIAVGVDHAAAREWATRLVEPVVQPMITGPELSVDAYRTRDGELLGCVARTRDLVVNGESQVSTVVDDAPYRPVVIAVLDALGLTGPALVQVIDTVDGPVVLECNPRLGGASTLSLAAGLRTPTWAVLEAAGEDPRQAAFRPRIGMRLVRTPWDSFDDPDPRP